MRRCLRPVLLLLWIVPVVFAAEPEVQHLKFAQHQCNQPPVDTLASSTPSDQRKIVGPRAGRPGSPLIAPNFPKDTLKTGDRAVVILELLVTEDGWIAEARVVQPSGWPVVDRAAMEVTEKWRMRPGTIDDEPKCMWMKFTVTEMR